MAGIQILSSFLHWKTGSEPAGTASFPTAACLSPVLFTMKQPGETTHPITMQLLWELTLLRQMRWPEVAHCRATPFREPETYAHIIRLPVREST